VALAESESTVSAAFVAAAMHTIKHGAATGAAAGLAQGAIRAMMLTKIKMTAVAVLAFGLLSVGTIFVAQPAATAGPDDKPGLVDPKTGQKLAPELDGLQGKWIVTSIRADGKDEEEGYLARMTFQGNKLLLKKRPEHDGDQYTVKVDASASPAQIDITKGGHTALGIFELNGDKLRICFRERGGKRPSEFLSEKGSNLILIELRRDRPAGGRRAGDGKVEDIVKLREELVKVRGELVAERDRAEKVEQELKIAIARAQAAEVSALADRKKAEEARLAEQVARIDAETERRKAELALVRAEAARKEAEAALERFRKATEKAKEEKKR
jgi:uncharacterized protein (TIGR03067 family)